MTVLADHFFVHLIAPESQPASTPVGLVMDIMDRKQDLFAYIIIKCYAPKEFYSVIIDTGAFKKSTVGYRQYFVYKTTINNNMDIDIMQTGAVNV